MADVVYTRFMTNKAHTDAGKSSSWKSETDPQKYGPKVVPPPGTTTDAPPADPEWTGDAVLRNETWFMRLTTWYLEFCYATAYGDSGRVLEIMKVSRTLCLSV